MSAIEILAVIGIIGYVIYQQVKGQLLRGKRTVLLPAVLTVIGFVNPRSGGVHLTGADIACLDDLGYGYGSRDRATARRARRARRQARHQRWDQS